MHLYVIKGSETLLLKVAKAMMTTKHIKSKEEGKDQESIPSSIYMTRTLYGKVTKIQENIKHTIEVIGQPFPVRHEHIYTTGHHFAISEILTCDVAGCSRMWSCDRKTELCRCKIEAGETFCSLKIPQIAEVTETLIIPQVPEVTETQEYQTFMYKLKQPNGKSKINLRDKIDLYSNCILLIVCMICD